MESLYLLTHEGRVYCWFLFYRWRGPPARLEVGKYVCRGRGRGHLPRPSCLRTVGRGSERNEIMSSTSGGYQEDFLFLLKAFQE